MTWWLIDVALWGQCIWTFWHTTTMKRRYAAARHQLCPYEDNHIGDSRRHYFTGMRFLWRPPWFSCVCDCGLRAVDIKPMSRADYKIWREIDPRLSEGTY